MNFERFQNQSRLYVIGALEPEETGRIRESSKEVREKRRRFHQPSATTCTKHLR